MLAREPRLTSAPVGPKKDSSGYGSGMGMSSSLFYGLGVLPGSTGAAVTPFTSLQVATVYACVKRLSEDLAKLPIIIRRRLPGGGYQVDRNHPLNKLFRRPNKWQNASQCWAFFVQALALRGNGYGVIQRGLAGEPIGFIPISPDRMSVHLATNGDVYYAFSHPLLGDGLKLHQDNMLHARGMSFDGIMGVSPIAMSQDVVGLAIAAQQHGAVVFRQGAQIKGIIKHPGHLSPEAKQNIKRDFDSGFAGVQNAGQSAVFEEGMTYETVGMTNEDAQFLETRQHSVIEICRLFGMPPHKIGDLSEAHYANVEQGNLAYISDTLQPMATQIEQAAEHSLLFDDEQDEVQIRFDFDAILRGDRKTRYDTYQIGIMNGVLSVNEARMDDGRQPIEGGDEHRFPLNTGAIGDAARPGQVIGQPAAGGTPEPATTNGTT